LQYLQSIADRIGSIPELLQNQQGNLLVHPIVFG
jgi:hypothetical protein